MLPYFGEILFGLTLVLVAGSTLLRKREPESDSIIGSLSAEAEHEPPDAADPQKASQRASAAASVSMRVAVSLLVLLCALFIILSKQYEADQQKWAYGVIGTVLGYWLKG